MSQVAEEPLGWKWFGVEEGQPVPCSNKKSRREESWPRHRLGGLLGLVMRTGFSVSFPGTWYSNKDYTQSAHKGTHKVSLSAGSLHFDSEDKLNSSQICYLLQSILCNISGIDPHNKERWKDEQWLKKIPMEE